MNKDIIITFEKKHEVISYFTNSFKNRWVIGIYNDDGFYPRHIYSKSFDSEDKAKDYFKKQMLKYKDFLKEGKGYFHNKLGVFEDEN